MMYDAKKPSTGGIEPIYLKSSTPEGWAELAVEVRQSFQQERQSGPMPPDLTKEQLKVEEANFWIWMTGFQDLSFRINEKAWNGYRYSGYPPPRESDEVHSQVAASGNLLTADEAQLYLEQFLQPYDLLGELPIASDPDAMLWQRLWIQSQELTQAWLFIVDGIYQLEGAVKVSQLVRDLHTLIFVIRSTANLCEALAALGHHSGSMGTTEIDQMGKEVWKSANEITTISRYFAQYASANPTVTLSKKQQERWEEERKSAKNAILKVQRASIESWKSWNIAYFVMRYELKYRYTPFYMRKLLKQYADECTAQSKPFRFIKTRTGWITRSLEDVEGFCCFIEDPKRHKRKKRLRV